MYYFTGFETGTLDECAASAGAAIIDTRARTGSYGLSVIKLGTSTPSVTIKPVGADGTWTTLGSTVGSVRFALWIDTLPTAPEEVCALLSVLDRVKASLRLTAAGRLTLHDSAGASVYTGPVLAAGQWWTIELYAAKGTNADLKLWIAGATACSTTADVRDENAGYALLGSRLDVNGSGYQVFFDDVALSDSGPIGDGRCSALGVTANGATWAWSGSFADVDETPPDGDLTFSTTSTGADTAARARFATTAASGIGPTINAAKLVVIVRDEGGNSNCKASLLSGVTQANTTGLNLSTAYAALQSVHTTDPATGAAWTAAALDVAEGGVINASAVAVRWTYVRLFVEWKPQPTDRTGADTAAFASTASGNSGHAQVASANSSIAGTHTDTVAHGAVVAFSSPHAQTMNFTAPLVEG